MIRHLASVAEIVDDMQAAVEFYRDVLGLSVEHEQGSGYAFVKIPGVLHFGIWSRRAAAESVFGDPEAGDRIPLGFSIGFEVDSVRESSETMKAKGWPVAQSAKTEPWSDPFESKNLELPCVSTRTFFQIGVPSPTRNGRFSGVLRIGGHGENIAGGFWGDGAQSGFRSDR